MRTTAEKKTVRPHRPKQERVCERQQDECRDAHGRRKRRGPVPPAAVKGRHAQDRKQRRQPGDKEHLVPTLGAGARLDALLHQVRIVAAEQGHNLHRWLDGQKRFDGGQGSVRIRTDIEKTDLRTFPGQRLVQYRPVRIRRKFKYRSQRYLKRCCGHEMSGHPTVRTDQERFPVVSRFVRMVLGHRRLRADPDAARGGLPAGGGRGRRRCLTVSGCG